MIMNELDIDYSKMPQTYAVCWADGCPKADTCLRKKCASHLPAKQLYVPSVNLGAVDCAAGECTEYRSAQPERNAYGMRHVYDAVPKNLYSQLHNRIMTRIGKRMYYYCYHEERPITPAMQRVFDQEFQAAGMVVPVVFDRYVDEINW